MPSSHILIHALYGISPSKFTVLLVHVVRSRTRIVSQPNTEVLDLERLLFMNLISEQSRRVPPVHRKGDDKEQRKKSPRVSNPIPPAS